jgi:hypothetical protein
MLEPWVDMEVVTAYLETLWRLILTQEDETNSEPYALVIDEAQLFIPQMGMKPTTPIINDMGKRGRYFKLSMMAATQRPATIQKDFLDQADLVFWQKLRGKALEAAAEGMSMSVREVRQLMKPFTKGTALLGDADAFIGDVDYLVVQVRPRRGLKTSAPAQPVVTSGLRPIDSKVLKQLQQMIKAEAPKTKKVEGVVQLDMSYALEQRVSAQQTALSQLKLRYAAMMIALYLDRDRLSKQLRMADEKVNALQLAPVAPVAQVKQKALIKGLEISADIEADEFVQKKTVTTKVETFRSSRSIKIMVNQQTGAFNAFLGRIENLRPIHHRVLAIALDAEGSTLSIDKLIINLDYSYDAMRHALADLFKMGLLLKLDSKTYQSYTHSLFRQRFEHLDQDELIEQLWGVIGE